MTDSAQPGMGASSLRGMDVPGHPGLRAAPDRERLVAHATAEPPNRRSVYLLSLCIAAFVVRLGAYYLRPGIVAPDEVFQYLEQAHRIVFGTGLVPWEYILGIRNWLVPGAIAGIMEVSRLAGDGPAIQVGAVAICMSLLSVCTVVCAFRWGCNVAGTAAGLIAGGLNAFWFEQVYYAPHPLADTIAAAIFMSGLYLACPGNERPAGKRLFWAGILFGLTLVVRIQLGPAVAFAALWCCGLDIRRRYLPLILGGVIPLAMLGIADQIAWGSPYRSIWLYVWLNADISASFGRSVQYAYLRQTLYDWQIFTPLIVGLAMVGARRLPVAGVIVVVIFETFSLVAHKELRFIYPAVPLILTAVGIGSADLGGVIARRLRVPLSQPSLGLAAIAFWIAVSVYLGAVSPFHYLWSEGTGTVEAFRLVNADPNACGVAVEPIDEWGRSGGYTLIRNGVPLVSLAQPGSGVPTSRYNYIFTFDISNHQAFSGTNLGDVPADRVNCWDEREIHGYISKVCLWHVRSGCISGHSVPLVATPPPFVVHLMDWAAGR